MLKKKSFLNKQFMINKYELIFLTIHEIYSLLFNQNIFYFNHTISIKAKKL